MDTDPTEIARLERLITEAFADVPYPAGELIEHDCDTCHKLRDDLKGQHWSQVPPEIMATHEGDQPLLSPDAWHFYLPAFLIQSLRDESMAEDMLVHLAPSYEHEGTKDLENKKFYAAHYQRLTPAQRDALCEYLEWLREGQIQSCIEWWKDEEWWQAKISEGIQPRDIVLQGNQRIEPEYSSLAGIAAALELFRNLP